MSAAAVRRAYAKATRMAVEQPTVPLPRPVLLRPARRVLSVKAALEWAFGAECAQVEFEEAGGAVVGRDTIAVLMDRGSLGCKVDGGGRSLPADDAEIIASFVAALPVGHGGRGMACRVAELARAGRVPDTYIGVRTACVPVAWRQCKHGVFARTEVIGDVETVYRGRKTVHPVLVCPVTYTPTPGQIAAARRDYLRWWGALRHIRDDLRLYAGLGSVDVTLDMPPAEPWNTAA
jgi:hypothetical protein